MISPRTREYGADAGGTVEGGDDFFSLRGRREAPLLDGSEWSSAWDASTAVASTITSMAIASMADTQYQLMKVEEKEERE